MENRYARAQARWLARKFPGWSSIRPEEAVRLTFQYDEGYSYSSYTYEDASFDIVIHYADGTATYLPAKDEDIDLTAMVVEGLELLEDDVRS